MLLALFMFFFGADFWNHYINFRNFTGEVNVENMEQDFSGVDQEGFQMSNQIFQGKIVLLDFWITTCGVCFEKFPLLQNFYEKHKGNPSIEILAVNKPIEEDEEGQAFRMIREYGFNFRAMIPRDSELPEKLRVLYYPTTIVLNTEGKLIYRGRLEGAMEHSELLLKQQ